MSEVNANILGEFSETLKKLMPVHEVKASVVKDKDFIELVVSKTIDALLEQGLLEDKLIPAKEVRDKLGLSTNKQLYSIKKLKPIRKTPNAHPRYRLSDINSYIAERS
jgi:hypothetical protein